MTLGELLRPSRTRLVHWLTESGLVGPDGSVRSWLDDRGSGFPYAEAGGLLLAWLTTQPEPRRALRESIARRLIQDAQCGEYPGKNGVVYAFDVAIVLRALHAHERAGTRTPCSGAVEILAGELRSLLDDRCAARSSAGVPERWSARFGPHLLKCALALGDLRERTGIRRWDRLADALFAELVPLQVDGRFPSEADGRTYVHAHAYALEGLAHGVATGREELRGPLGEGADWLARVQEHDGGLRAWHDGSAASGEVRSDATAQAVRIWTLVDPGRFGDAIARALARLARLQRPSGALAYGSECADETSWSAVFAAQAEEFASGGADARALV